MRYVLLFLALILCGCQDRDARAQAASDADAGIVAAIGSLKTLGYDAAQPAVDILVASRKYLAPAADVPHSEWPAPTMAPNQIIDRPRDYSDAAPPEPKPWGAGVWAGLGTAATVGLWAAKRLLPLIPGIGGPIQSLIGTIADVAWQVTAHADQKQADKAKEIVRQAAEAAAPLLSSLRDLPPDLMPETVRVHLSSPLVAAALEHLATQGDK